MKMDEFNLIEEIELTNEESLLKNSRLPEFECDLLTKNQELDISIFSFDLCFDGKSYMISAKDKAALPSLITIPSTYEGLPVTIIKSYGFSECNKLSIVLYERNSNIDIIGAGAFFGCTLLESMVLPKRVTIIGIRAFASCTMLQHLYLRSKLPPRLGRAALRGTSSDLVVYVPPRSLSAYRKSRSWKELRDRIVPLLHRIPSDLGYFRFELNSDQASYSIFTKDIRNEPRHLVIPREYCHKPVTVIGYHAFNTPYIEDVYIPSCIERIEELAFSCPIELHGPFFPVYSGSILKRVTIENGTRLRYIGTCGLFGNVHLKEFHIPMTVTYIGTSAFTSAGFEDIGIPEHVEYIGDNAFSQCFELKYIHVDPNNKYYTDIDGVLFNYTGSSLISYPLNKENDSYTIPYNVGSIPNPYAFWGCRNLRVLYVDSSYQPPVTKSDFSIGVVGFKVYVSDELYERFLAASGWSSIKDKIFPKSIIKNDFAVYNSTLIQYVGAASDITIPENITAINSDALASYNKLENIRISEQNRYFRSVNGVLFNKDQRKLLCYPPAKNTTEYEIPSPVTILAQNSFLGCRNLVTVKTHKALAYIDEYAFFRCAKLKNLISLDAKDNITTFGAYSFCYCNSLEELKLRAAIIMGTMALAMCNNIRKITFGKEIAYIGDNVYARVETKLTELTIYALLPPDTTFSRNDNTNLKRVNVPRESLELYRSHSQWQAFSDILYPLEETIMQ